MLSKIAAAAPPNSATRRGRIATHAGSLAVPDNPREATRRIAHEFVKGSILFLIAEIVDFEFQTAQLGLPRICRLPLGWARLKASRNARLSEGGKWQISKMISRCGAGIGPE